MLTLCDVPVPRSAQPPSPPILNSFLLPPSFQPCCRPQSLLHGFGLGVTDLISMHFKKAKFAMLTKFRTPIGIGWWHLKAFTGRLPGWGHESWGAYAFRGYKRYKYSIPEEHLNFRHPAPGVESFEEHRQRQIVVPLLINYGIAGSRHCSFVSSLFCCMEELKNYNNLQGKKDMVEFGEGTARDVGC